MSNEQDLMREAAVCICGSSVKIEASEPCDDYPGNGIANWDTHCECPRCGCHPRRGMGKRFKSKEEAICARVEQWNKFILGLKAARQQAVPSGYVMVPVEVVQFLKGEADLDGMWFGEHPPRRPFWWRKHLAALAAAPQAEQVVEDWSIFPGYLLDKCEDQTVSEEMLQRWFASMLEDPHYGALFRREKAPHPSVTAPPTPDVSALIEALEKAATAMWNSEANMDNEAADIECALADYRSAKP